MQRDEWSCLNCNLQLQWGMPIGFVNYAMALCGKAYPLWGVGREDYENMMMGMELRPLPRLHEMEPFVRICHGHFPLKQCTLEADQHLVGINLHGLMTAKERMPLFYFGGKFLSGSVWRKQQFESTRVQKQMCCCPDHRVLPLFPQKRDLLYINNDAC